MPDHSEPETPRATYIWRGMLRHVPKSKPSYTPSRTARLEHAAGRAFHALLPWKKKEYPGQWEGWSQALGGRAARDTVRNWARGHGSLPSWARDMLADRLEERARTCLEAAQALREEGKAMPARRATGFAVPGADGLDGRSKSGRRPAKGDREL